MPIQAVAQTQAPKNIQQTPATEPKAEAKAQKPALATPLATRAISAEKPKLAALAAPKTTGALRTTTQPVKAEQMRGSSKPADEGDLVALWWMLELLDSASR